MAFCRMMALGLPLCLVLTLCDIITGLDYTGLMHEVDRLASGQHTANMRMMGRALLTDPSSTKFQGDLWRHMQVKALEQSLSPVCLRETEEVLDGIKNEDLWALTMADATTKIESGIFQGNRIWSGDFAECLSVEAYSAPDTKGNVTHLFNGKHCSMVIANTSDLDATAGMAFPGFLLGGCFPDVCSDSDVLVLVNSTLEAFLPKSLHEIQAVYGLCHTANSHLPLDSAAIGVIAMLSVIGAVLIIATLYDIMVIQSRFIGFWHKSRAINIDHDELIEENDVEYQNSQESEASVEEEPFDIRVVENGKFDRFPMLMVRLSMYSNAARILHTSPGKSSLECIHGIRFLSMTWVILGHSYALGVTFLRNPVQLLEIAKGFAFQAVLNATVSVDTFFLLSGTLVSYLLLRKLQAANGPRNVNWFIFYFHRYWRLTPPYMIILGVHTALYKYMATGPLWGPTGIEPDCASSWWANLLYVNNLVAGKKNCMGWAWYLAIDMQFFVFCPFFIIALYKHRVLGVVLCSAAIVGSTIARGVITHVHHLPGSMVVMADTDLQNEMFNYLYIVPYARLGPYMVGILLGYIIVQTKCKVTMRWYIACVLWVLAAVVAMSVLYGQYSNVNGHVPTPFVDGLYASLYRTAWAVAVAWVIFACVSGLGGPVNTLLTWPALVPLSRLTYMAYLIHPVVVIGYFNLQKIPMNVEQATMIYAFLGNLCVSYALAFVGSLLFEAPMLGLEKTVFWKKPEP